MNRFTKQPRRMTGVKYLISIGIFCVILFWFLGGLSSISNTTSEQELESLKQAVIRSSVQCYALEGFYPESLEYLEDHYGLTYDASNLMPSIDVFALNETEVDFNEE